MRTIPGYPFPHFKRPRKVVPPMNDLDV